jgi:hypothetical protein
MSGASGGICSNVQLMRNQQGASDSAGFNALYTGDVASAIPTARSHDAARAQIDTLRIRGDRRGPCAAH